MKTIDYLFCMFVLDMIMTFSLTSQEVKTYILVIQIAVLSVVYFYNQMFRKEVMDE